MICALLRCLAVALLALATCLLLACGGGGSSLSVASSSPPSPTLVSIELSPLTASLPPGGTQSVTVTGTYSEGTTKTLVASGATVGQTAIIGAMDVASSICASTGPIPAWPHFRKPDLLAVSQQVPGLAK
jgi:hypothetical protein